MTGNKDSIANLCNFYIQNMIYIHLVTSSDILFIKPDQFNLSFCGQNVKK